MRTTLFWMKLTAWLVGLVLLMVLGVASAIGWLLKTQSGLEWSASLAAGQLPVRLNQTFQYEGLQGSLWDGFAADSLTWSDGLTTVDLQGLVLRADWGRLLDQQLVVNTLKAKRVRVVLPPSDNQTESTTPLELPQRIDLPVEVFVQSLELAELQVAEQVVSDLSLKAELTGHPDGTRLELQELGLAVQGALVRLNGEAELFKPYALRMSANAQRQIEGVLDLNAALKVLGNLDSLQLTLNAEGTDLNNSELSQSVRVEAQVQPLKSHVLPKLEASAKRFNPSRWIAQAPDADLDFEATIRPSEDFSSSTGQLTVANRRANAWPEGGLPIEWLDLRFNLGLQNELPQSLRAQIQALRFKAEPQTDSSGKVDSKGQSRSPDAGELTGVIEWQRTGKTLPDSIDTAGNVTVDLRLDGIRPDVWAAMAVHPVLSGHLRVIKEGDAIQIQQADLNDRGANVALTGRVSLSGRSESEIKARFAQVNPALLVPEVGGGLKGLLNGDLLFAGALGDLRQGALNPVGSLQASLMNSQLANTPVNLMLNLQGGLQKVESLRLVAEVLGNTLTATGSGSEESVAIDLDANLPHLDRLSELVGVKSSGLVNVKGRLTGPLKDVQGDLNVDVQKLKVGQTLALQSLKGQVKLGLSPDSVWKGSLGLSNLTLPSQDSPVIESAQITLEGVTRAHSLVLDIKTGLNTFSRSRALALTASATGGLTGAGPQATTPVQWSGLVNELKLEGLWRPVNSFELLKPAPVKWSPALTELGLIVLKGEDDSQIEQKLLQVSARQLLVEGSAPRLTVPRIRSIVKQQVTLEPKLLVTQLDWRFFSNPQEVDGHFELKRLSGGFAILEDSEIDVPVNDLSLVADFDRSRVSAELVLDAPQVGDVSGNLVLPLKQDPQTRAWSLDNEQSISGALAAGLTDLTWLGPLISPGIRTAGSGQVAVALSGSLNDPRMEGRLFARELGIFQIDQGIRLEEGNVVVDFNNDRAKLEQMDFAVYFRNAPGGRIEELGPLIQGTGRVSGQGVWNLDGLDGGLELTLDNVGLLQRSDRWLVADAKINVTQPPSKGLPIKVRGTVEARGAYVELPEEEPQTLGDDVVIRGRTEIGEAGAPIDVEIVARLGDNFYLNAEGLKTRLAGGLTMTVIDGETPSGRRGKRLEARGTIRTVDGTYRAYGQDLTIQRGVVNFQGPLANPGLNIRAVRQGVAVEAGVEITGSAGRPKVTLVSEPAVPDSEKLSWMILGRGSNASDRDTAILLTAAAAIFGDNDESTTRKIARSLGIDDFALSSGSLTAADSRAVGSRVAIAPGADDSAAVLGADDPLLSQRIITLGKRLNREVYLNFEQSVTTAANIVKLTYQYSRRLSFIARTGADNAVDVLYQFSFD